MGKRINIVLPETTIRTIDGIAKAGHRSRFIDQAVRYFVANRSAEALRAQLERAAIRDRDLDREIAADWFAVDRTSWQQLETSERRRKPVTRDGEKSTLRRSTRP
jgi:CopG family transcriptional regulator/antitoxin EndoAI